MEQKFNGSCLCGRVKYEIVGQFQSFFLCHCTRCQKDTGSVHAANLFAHASTLIWTQGAGEVKTYRHPETRHTKSFCLSCGSALPTATSEPDCVVVPAGSLDSAVPIQPTAHIFMGSSAHWAHDLSHVPSYDQQPGSD